MDNTGIPELDEILGGGLPRPSSIGIQGSMGCGKKQLVQEIVANMLHTGHAVSYYTVDEPAFEIKEKLQALDVNVEKHENDKMLFFIDIFSKAVENVSKSYKNHEPGSTVLQSGLSFADLVDMGREFTLKNMKRRVHELVILDSVTPFFLTTDAKVVFHYCQTLKYATRFANAIGIALHHSNILDDKLENALRGFADGIIEMKKTSEMGNEINGTMKVLRMTGNDFLPEEYYFEISNNRMRISLIVGIV